MRQAEQESENNKQDCGQSYIDKAWYVVYTKPKQEVCAKLNLERQNYHVYLPFFKYRRRIRGRNQEVIEPMFPRYLFIQLDKHNDDWSPIRSTYGVSAIVSFGSEPASIPTSVILELKASSNQEDVFYSPDQELRKGDKIRIIEGTMVGMEGILIAQNSKDRMQVLVLSLGNTLDVDISADKIEKVF